MLIARTGKILVPLVCLVVLLACASPARAEGVYIQFEEAYVGGGFYGVSRYDHPDSYSFYIPGVMGGAGLGIVIGCESGDFAYGFRMSLASQAGEISGYPTTCRHYVLSAIVEMGVGGGEDFLGYFLVEPSIHWVTVDDGCYDSLLSLYMDETFLGSSIAFGGGLKARLAGGLAFNAVAAYRFGHYDLVMWDQRSGTLYPDLWWGGLEFRMGIRYSY